MIRSQNAHITVEFAGSWTAMLLRHQPKFRGIRKLHIDIIYPRFCKMSWYIRHFIRYWNPHLALAPSPTMSVMMTPSKENIFRVTGPLCGEFTGPSEFPTQRPVTRSFDVFFDLRLNKRLSKQPWGWWFETPSWSLWSQCNDCEILSKCGSIIQSAKSPRSIKHWRNFTDYCLIKVNRRVFAVHGGLVQP